MAVSLSLIFFIFVTTWFVDGEKERKKSVAKNASFEIRKILLFDFLYDFVVFSYPCYNKVRFYML